MDYLSNLKNIFISESAQRLYVTIPPERADPPFDAAPIKAETAYLRLLLTDMYLARRRVLTQTRYPIVQAFCRFLYDGEKQEINLVAGPQQMQRTGHRPRAADAQLEVFRLARRRRSTVRRATWSARACSPTHRSTWPVRTSAATTSCWPTACAGRRPVRCARAPTAS